MRAPSPEQEYPRYTDEKRLSSPLLEEDREDDASRKLASEHKRLHKIVVVLVVWAVATTSLLVCSSHGLSLNDLLPSFPIPHYKHHHRTGCHGTSAGEKKNVIMMVSDGMGPASVNLARTFRQYRDGLERNNVLTLDENFIGHSRTMSSDSFITDSAAGGTAFACGHKTYNGAIAVLDDKSPCGTVLEAAKLKGYKTGLVVTTQITDATPASFSAHANDRSEQDLIAEQQIGENNNNLGRMVDLILGGGRCHFLPSELVDGCRADTRNLIEESKDWNYIGDLPSFKELGMGENVSLPLLGLLAPTDIPFDIDRDVDVYPSLAEMTTTALRALDRATEDSEQGFFIMIEGSRIDHAGHMNDPAAQTREVLAYDDAFKAAIEFARSTDTETIIVSTSDHETGGLTVGRQTSKGYPEYEWQPQVLLNATHSGHYLAEKIKKFEYKHKKELKHFIETEILEHDLGIYDYKHKDVKHLVKHHKDAANILVDMVSTRARVGFTTHGHTAVDVNVYGYSNTPEKDAEKPLRGTNENTHIGTFFESYLGLNLQEVSEKLQGIKTQNQMHNTIEQQHDDYYHPLNTNPM